MARNERGRGVTVVDESMDDYTYGTLDFGHSQSTRGLGVGQGPAITSTLPRSKAGQQQQHQQHQHQAAGAAQWAASSIPLNDESIGGLNAHSPNLPSPGFLHGAHLRRQVHLRQAGDETLSTEQGTEMGAAGHHRQPTQQTTSSRAPDSWVDHDSWAPGVARGVPESSTRPDYRCNVNSRQAPAFPPESIHPSPAVAERYARGARGAYASGTAQQRASYPASSSSLDTASEDEDDEDDISETRTPETRSTGNHVDLRATPVGQSRTVKQFDRPTLGEEKMARLKAAEQRNFRHGKNRTEARRDAQTQQDGEGLAARAQRINRATSTSRANLPSSPSPAPSLTRKGVHRSTQASIDDRRAEQADDIFSQAAPRPQAGDDHEQAHKDDSGGSGYAAGAPSGQEGESSGETLLGSGNVWKGDAYHGMQGLDMPWMRLPSGQKVGQGAYEARLPDLTGITSAMASPAQARDTHVPLAKLRPPPQELDELAQRLDAVKATMQAEEIDMRGQETYRGRAPGPAQVHSSVPKLPSNGLGPLPARRSAAEAESVPREFGFDVDRAQAEAIRAMRENVDRVDANLDSYRAYLSYQYGNAALPMDIQRQSAPNEALQRPARDDLDRAALRTQLSRVEWELRILRKVADSESAHVASSPGPTRRRTGLEEEQPRSKAVQRRRSLSFDRNEQVVDLADESAVEGDLGAKGFDALHHDAPSRHVRYERVEVPRSSTPPANARPATPVQAAHSQMQPQPQRQAAPKEQFKRSQKYVTAPADDPDETVRPSREKGKSGAKPSETQDAAVQPVVPVELDEADVTAAHERAERVFETIALDMGQQTAHTAPNADTTVVAAQPGTHHNAITCTVCGSLYKKERKRVARKEKARRAADAGALADEETVLALLEAGEESGGARMKFGAKQIKVLKRLIKEHMDEFIHSRMLYAELADELKLVEPSMSSKNRQILAEHVLEAVETLEFRAQRINHLQALLPGTDENKNEVLAQVDNRMGSRENRNEDGAKSQEGPKKSRAQTDSRPRVNSPPTIDGAPHQVSKTRPVRS